MHRQSRPMSPRLASGQKLGHRCRILSGAYIQRLMLTIRCRAAKSECELRTPQGQVPAYPREPLYSGGPSMLWVPRPVTRLCDGQNLKRGSILSGMREAVIIMIVMYRIGAGAPDLEQENVPRCHDPVRGLPVPAQIIGSPKRIECSCRWATAAPPHRLTRNDAPVHGP